MENVLVVVAGPTAVGKTKLCVQLAKHLSTEIISFDSRQMYRELSIGTAKPDALEQDHVPHHFIDSHSITQELSAGQFAREAELVLHNLFQTYKTVLITGGSGLYLQALLEGLDEVPEVPSHLRQELMLQLSEQGLSFLQAELKLVDPVFFTTADIQNPVRVVRALEVFRGTGKPFSSFRKGEKRVLPYRVVKLMLNRDKDELHQRIHDRVDHMLASGLVEEASALIQHRQSYALRTVGYQEVYQYLDGLISYQQMIDLLKKNTRNYAKRQITWFKRDPEYTWLHPDHKEEIIQRISSM
ncbi:MAG: tRNA (adenosine(37)-N6)-dimethylallyltransferase MiaA [Cytophagaceae bacterium]|jgi:tRNA dimethylallyltransferase|nr:tRNA (adenosine(37)-N6)-dimethylallyltransferase MiaA [Cytophagaceae bacterium]